jgi:hypothetical protein
MPPRFSFNTDLTLGVNAPLKVHYVVAYSEAIIRYSINGNRPIIRERDLESSPAMRHMEMPSSTRAPPVHPR